MSTNTNSGTTVVLGWDGLDYDLLNEFGLRDAFGAHHDRIETFDNPALGTPHTREVWPSIITGVGPDTHGIRAAEDDGTVEWDNPWIGLAAQLAEGMVPQSVRTEIGKHLRNNGAGLDSLTPADYQDRGLSTVFDGRRALPISVPNYLTETDRLHGLTSDRAELWHDIIESKDADGYEPTVETDVVDQRLCGVASQRLGLVETALQREYDLVFCWLGYIDSVGHIAPCVGEAGWQRRHYDQAVRWTDRIRSEMDSDDTLACVSDHGLQHGEHTHQATIASDNPGIVGATESVFDVAGVLDQATPSRTSSGAPAVRDGHAPDGSREDWSVSEVEDQLADLGYV